MSDTDYYKTLGLGTNASADEVKRAYRRLAMQYHPDLNRGREDWANDKFKQINEAFGVLGDPEKRRLYDHFGASGSLAGTPGSPSSRADLEDLVNDFAEAGLRFDPLDDLLGNDFQGTGFAAWRFRRRFRGPGGAGLGEERSIDLDA